jgi:hypothetical protein
MNNNIQSIINFPAPVLAEPRIHTVQSVSVPGGEARESTKGDAEPVVRLNERSNLVGPTSDSRGGENLLPRAESVIREGNRQGVGVPVHSSARGDSKSVPKNSAGISQSCGSSEELPLISDSQMDLAWAYFWGKRKMTPPTVSSGGIMPSVSDFDDELSILQMRATI